MSWLSPVTLAGKAVTLVPLEQSHLAELREAVADGQLWTLWYTSVPAPEKMAAEIETGCTCNKWALCCRSR